MNLFLGMTYSLCLKKAKSLFCAMGTMLTTARLFLLSLATRIVGFFITKPKLYMESKDPRLENNEEEIYIGSIVAFSGITEAMVYAKVLSIEKINGVVRYDVMSLGSGTSNQVARNEIYIPKSGFATRDVAISQDIIDHKKGDTAQIINKFLYIGGDDILVGLKYAKLCKII